MMEFLSGLMDAGFVDEPAPDPEAEIPLGLVVSAPAEHGEDLIEEARIASVSMRGIPFVIFIEEDEDGNEVFGNAAEYQVAMDRLRPPTEEEATAWCNRVVGERLAALGWKP